MKTTLLACAIATCFSAPVMAQSSIVIYGIADAGLVYQDTGGGPKTKIASGIADGSRLGFKGTEDMGGGYKAIFNLEARVELDTGGQQPTLMNDNQGFYLTRGMEAFGPALPLIQRALQVPGSPAVNRSNALFDRTSMVGLITPVGAVLLGRMYTPGYEVFAAADAFESGTAGQWGNVTGGAAGFTALGADIRSDNAIQYRIVHPSGLGGAFMYGAQDSGYIGLYKKFLAANVVYKANGWDVGIGHNRGYDMKNNTSLTTTTVGGSYSLNNMKFFAGYHDQRDRHSGLLDTYIAGYDNSIAPALARNPNLSDNDRAALRNVFVTNITRNTQIDAAALSIGMHYRIGAGRIIGSVSHQNDRSASNNDATQYALGYDYNLSKRTDVYAVAAYIKNQNEGQYAPGIAGSPGGFVKVPGESARAINLGIRHRF
ncbi:MAG: putative porin [Janthinobacterium sp.]|jgi:predicted porin